jgi:hypothetical protein
LFVKSVKMGLRVPVSGSTLIKVGAAATILGSALLVAAPIFRKVLKLVLLESAGETRTLFVVVTLALFFVALLLLPLGMMGFHLLQRRNYGHLGSGGFLTIILSSLTLASGLAGYLWGGSLGLLWLSYPVGTSGLMVGFVLYGIATLQARVLPSWCGLVFTGALPATIALLWIRPFFGFSEGVSTTAILFGLSWLGLGYALLRKVTTR